MDHQPAATLRCGDRTFELDRRTFVMGIVNVTPDSFSDGGRFLAAGPAYDHAMTLLDEGADIIDLGAESTRPGAVPVSRQEEFDRLLPVVERLVGAGIRCLSIDTSKAAVAAAALGLGASWINDVSGLADPAMAGVARAADALVVMHQRPMTAGRVDDDVTYTDVVAEVGARLAEICRRAVADGVEADRLIVDPGLGFGKTVADNFALLARADELRSLGHPVLVGPSRKRFLRATTGATSTAALDAATLAACCVAALRGVEFVRVHRVAELPAALAVTNAIRNDHRRADPAQ